jgi:hypothetical protein
MAVLEWLTINAILPLLPIVFFYIGTLMITGTIAWVPPIRDGQICFYATTIAIIAIKDIVAAKPTEAYWLYGLVVCWLISFFVYSFSVYSTIYPSRSPTNKRAIDVRVAFASIACGVLTTATVVGLRLYYGILKVMVTADRPIRFLRTRNGKLRTWLFLSLQRRP